MKILGIESSCDDTSISVYDSNTKQVLSLVSQHSLPIVEQYGGIHCELIARNHLAQIKQICSSSLKEAKCTLQDINLVAYCNAPGLISSLSIGTLFACGLAVATTIPKTAVNHVQAHINSAFIHLHSRWTKFLGLVISGGHTHMFICQQNNYHLIDCTLDDAMGECFDKCAILLGLTGGGAQVEQLAKMGKIYVPLMQNLPQVFSFSGLKTAVKNILCCKKWHKEDICYSLQVIMWSILKKRVLTSVYEQQIFKLTVSGGVISNQFLRNKLLQLAKIHCINILFPEQRYCVDNGAMIAYQGYLNHLAGKVDKSLGAKNISTGSYDWS